MPNLAEFIEQRLGRTVEVRPLSAFPQSVTPALISVEETQTMGDIRTYLHVEIVQVVNKTYLMDAEGNECKYFRNTGEALARGHYVVIWPQNWDIPRFDQNASFYGPYSLGLIAKLKVAEHVAAFAGPSQNYGQADDRATDIGAH